jgi:phenylalanine-4-hydroxylase
MKTEISSTTKHGLAAGETGNPGTKDWTIDQGWECYTHLEHLTWKTLFERQMKLLPGRACSAFLRGVNELPFNANQIPNFQAINEVLERRTGWRVVAVPGLVPDDIFFEHLANRRFPSGNFIRKADQLDYLQEPDIFHDVFGHIPMLMNPVMADFIQAYGEGGLKARSLGVLDKLARVYWYTVEFGLVQEKEGLRFYGAGIASSGSETVFSVESPSPNRIHFDLHRVMRTRYRIDNFQETYFVLRNLDELLKLAHIDFSPLYEEVKSTTDIDPGDKLPSDDVITSGTGSYHSSCKSKAYV